MIISTGVHSVTTFKVSEAEALIGGGVHHGYTRKILITSEDGSTYEITAFADDKAALNRTCLEDKETALDAALSDVREVHDDQSS